MPIPRLIRYLVGALLLLGLLPGCGVFQQYRPVAVAAIDAETKQPLQGVEVKISYPLETSPLAPTTTKETTGADGIARLQAAPFRRAGVYVELNAKGYQSEYRYLRIDEVEAIESAHWFEDVKRRPTNFTMAMFADPAPKIEVILPLGFRGQIKVKAKGWPDAPAAAGQRAFRYEVPATATELEINGPMVLKHATATSFQFNFADGTPVSMWAKNAMIGVWFLKSEAGWYIFLIGSPRDHQNYLLAMQSSVPDRPAHGGGGGGGGGKHGRRGGGSNMDPSSSP